MSPKRGWNRARFTRLLSSYCGALALSVSVSAWAHHPGSTARVASGGVWGGGSAATAVALPRLSSQLAYSGRYYGRVLEGTRDYDKAEFGSVVLNTLDLQLELELESATRFGFRIPAGIVELNSPSEGKSRSPGFGDIELFVEQELVSVMAEEPSRFELRPRVGLTIPSGRYEPGASLSVTDVSGASDGSLNVATYSAQASLGADAWSALSGLEFRWQPLTGLGLSVSTAWVAPFTRTRDEILWGSDLSTRLGVELGVLDEALSVIAGLDHRHHFPDELPVVDETTGAKHVESLGSSDELAVGLGARAVLGQRVSCSLEGRVPVWQRVDGIGLVETVSGRASCRASWGL